LYPSATLMISKAGMKGLVSLFRPATIPTAWPARTARAAKKCGSATRPFAFSGVMPLCFRSSTYSASNSSRFGSVAGSRTSIPSRDAPSEAALSWMPAAGPTRTGTTRSRARSQAAARMALSSRPSG